MPIEQRKSFRELANQFLRMPRTWGLIIFAIVALVVISFPLKNIFPVKGHRESWPAGPMVKTDAPSDLLPTIPGKPVLTSDERVKHHPFDLAGHFFSKAVDEEVTLTRKAQELLDDVLGAGNAKVIIHIQAESKSKTFRSESLDPNGVITSENQSSGQTVVTWDNGRTVREEIESAGGIKKMYLTVLVRENTPGSTDVRLAQELVCNAVGFDESRGDVLLSRRVPGNLSPMRSYWRKGSSLSVLAGLAIGILIFIWVWMTRGKRIEGEDERSGQNAEHEEDSDERMIRDLRAAAHHRPDEIVRAVEDYLFEMNSQ